MNLSEQQFQRNPDTAWRSLREQAFIVSLDQGSLHKLNPSGTRIWELLCEGRVPSDIAEAIAAEFDVAPDVARRDTLEFIQQLLEKDVIRIAENNA